MIPCIRTCKTAEKILIQGRKGKSQSEPASQTRYQCALRPECKFPFISIEHGATEQGLSVAGAGRNRHLRVAFFKFAGLQA
jgi:hypothetical protein